MDQPRDGRNADERMRGRCGASVARNRLRALGRAVERAAHPRDQRRIKQSASTIESPVCLPATLNSDDHGIRHGELRGVARHPGSGVLQQHGAQHGDPMDESQSNGVRSPQRLHGHRDRHGARRRPVQHLAERLYHLYGRLPPPACPRTRPRTTTCTRRSTPTAPICRRTLSAECPIGRHRPPGAAASAGAGPRAPRPTPSSWTGRTAGCSASP